MIKPSILKIVSLLSLMIVLSCSEAHRSNPYVEEITSSVLAPYPDIKLHICTECETMQDAIEYEEKMGSKRLNLPGWQIERIVHTSIQPSWDITKVLREDSVIPSTAAQDHLLYERFASDLQGFSHLVIYTLYLNTSDYANKFYEVKYTHHRFHLGEDQFGYSPVGVMLKNSDQFNLTTTYEMDQESFKESYFALIKSFLNLLPQKSKILTTEHELLDDYYYILRSVSKDMMELDDNWFYDFMDKEHGFWDANDNILGFLVPNTHAPIRFYAVEFDSRDDPVKYKMTVSDLSFELVYINQRYYSKL